MNCPRCNASLPSSSWYCSVCGLNLRLAKQESRTVVIDSVAKTHSVPKVESYKDNAKDARQQRTCIEPLDARPVTLGLSYKEVPGLYWGSMIALLVTAFAFGPSLWREWKQDAQTKIDKADFRIQNQLLAFQSHADALCKQFGIQPVKVEVIERKNSECHCLADYNPISPVIRLNSEFVNSNPSLFDITTVIAHEVCHHLISVTGRASDFANGHNEAFIKVAVDLGLNIDSTLNGFPETRPIYERLLAEKKYGSIYSQQHLQKMADEMCKQLQVAPVKVEVVSRSNRDCGCASDYHPDTKTILVNAEYLSSRPEKGAFENGLRHDVLHHYLVVQGLSTEDYVGGHGEAFLRHAIDLQINVEDVLVQWPELRPIFNSLVNAKKNKPSKPLI